MTTWSKWRGAGTSRRAFLGGAAAAITLPWMRSLQPTQAVADGTPPVRLLFYFIPNGVHMPAWVPTAEGQDFELPTILAPLAPVRDDLLVLTGLANRAGEGDRPGDHARGTGCVLTCAQPAYDTVLNGVSVDQVAANTLGHETAFRSLQLGTATSAASGLCDSGYPCAYQSNISWAGPKTPLPKLTNPTIVFERLFGGFDSDLTEVERVRRAVYRSSVLDHVVEDAASLQASLGTTDRHRLDEYLTGVRELERRLDGGDLRTCVAPRRPPTRFGLAEQVDLLHELMVVALQCDLTRYVTFMVGNGGSNYSFDFLGVSGAHHEISHHQSRQQNLEKLVTINTWEINRFSNLLQRLKAVPEGEGTLLDQCLVCLTSEIGDGDRHNHDDLPVLLAGRGGGAVTPGRHVVHDETPIANLYLSMLEAAGAPQASFADSTGPLGTLSA
jgi:hypothetical protein